MKIKEILGICGVKGCFHRAYCTATITVTRKNDGKPIKRRRKLCKCHTLKIVEQGTITGLTTTCNVNFPEEDYDKMDD